MNKYYEILGIQDTENITKEKIRPAFLKKAKKVHPDHNQSKEANEEFKKLYEAYEKLLKQFTEDGEFTNEEFTTTEEKSKSYSNFMFFDKDMQYWLTKIFEKIMPSFIQQGYEPTGKFLDHLTNNYFARDFIFLLFFCNLLILFFPFPSHFCGRFFISTSMCHII